MSPKYKRFYQLMYDYYNKEVIKSRLRFHGWNYVTFILKKSLRFANELGADPEQVQLAALICGFFTRNPQQLLPAELMTFLLEKFRLAGYDNIYAEKIISMYGRILLEGRTEKNLSNEEKALSDAICLFRVLPLTPVIFSSKYMEQSNISLEETMNRILNEQSSFITTETLFYTESAKKNYNEWAKTSLELWLQIKEALRDPDIVDLLDDTQTYRSLQGEYKIAVGAIIVNDRNEVLIAQRNKESENAPRSWELIYGRMNQGEDPFEALKREVCEEVGLNVTPEHIVGVKHFIRTRNDLEHVAIIYLVSSAKTNINLQKDEVMDYKWIPIEKAEDMVAEYDKKLIRDAISYINSK